MEWYPSKFTSLEQHPPKKSQVWSDKHQKLYKYVAAPTKETTRMECLPRIPPLVWEYFNTTTIAAVKSSNGSSRRPTQQTKRVLAPPSRATIKQNTRPARRRIQLSCHRADTISRTLVLFSEKMVHSPWLNTRWSFIHPLKHYKYYALSTNTTQQQAS